MKLHSLVKNKKILAQIRRNNKSLFSLVYNINNTIIINKATLAHNEGRLHLFY